MTKELLLQLGCRCSTWQILRRVLHYLPSEDLKGLCGGVPPRYEDDEAFALEDSCQGCGPANPANSGDASQDEDPISLEDAHQESADAGG